MKRAIVLLGAALMLTLAGVPAHAADDPEKIFKEVIQLYQEGDLEGALEEAKWGIERMEQMRQDKVSEVFPDKIGDFEGQALNKNKAMGIMVTERRYTGNGKTVNVSLTEGSSGGGALSGLGALMQMGGAMSGGRKVRIDRRSGTAMSEGSSNSVVVALESGGNLTFASSDLTLEEVIAFAEDFPVKELDEARGG